MERQRHLGDLVIKDVVGGREPPMQLLKVDMMVLVKNGRVLIGDGHRTLFYGSLDLDIVHQRL